MASSSSERAWLKLRELAARERVDPRTVRRWIEKGILERRRFAVRTGVRVRYREADISGH
jgi:predicted site-specific integrase-resolvase